MSTAVVIRPHVAKSGDPIRLRAGDEVTVHRADTEFPGWYWCSASDGGEGWVHASFLSRIDGAATAIRDYSSAELAVEAGTRVEVLERVGGWAYVVLGSDREGWLPEACIAPQG